MLWFAIGYGFQRWSSHHDDITLLHGFFFWWFFGLWVDLILSWVSKVVVVTVGGRERERQVWTWQPSFGSLEANLVLRLFMLLRLPTVHSFGFLHMLEGGCYGVPMITLPLAEQFLKFLHF